jgi:hypothetical protein
MVAGTVAIFPDAATLGSVEARASLAPGCATGPGQPWIIIARSIAPRAQLLTFPLMWAIQIISAQIGRVTGRGLAGNMRRHHPASLLYVLVSCFSVSGAPTPLFNCRPGSG